MEEKREEGEERGETGTETKHKTHCQPHPSHTHTLSPPPYHLRHHTLTPRSAPSIAIIIASIMIRIKGDQGDKEKARS